MPQKTNLNANPYFDDFDKDKNFLKVLFRSGYSIQTRELITLQSILQNQIENFGKYSFKQGQQVVPGEVGLNTALDYVKLSSVSEVGIGNPDGTITYSKYDIRDLVGQQLRGITSGVVGVVLDTSLSSATESDTLFVNYVSSGNENNEKTFRQGETLEVVDGVNTPLLVVGVDGSVLPTSITVENPITGDVTTEASPAMGFASGVEVEEGIYFVNGFFVRNNKQLLVIDKYSSKTSAKVGFNIVEEIVTPEQDTSLYDNSRGYSNASAPGAHRLKITLELVEFGYSEKTDNNFIQLLKINQGQIEKEVKKADYTLLEDTLARRTYDESGDYVVEDFPIQIREFYQKDGNNGLYRLDPDDNTVNGLSPEEADSKMLLGIGSGKAYVRGYEIVNKSTKDIVVDKARDTLERDNVTLKSSGLATYSITNLSGTVPLNTVGGEITSYPDVYFNSVFNDGTIGLNGLESEGYFKNTISRRSQSISPAQGIKTIYVQVADDVPSIGDVFPTTLWFAKTTSDGTPTTVDSVEVIGTSVTNRPETNDNPSQVFVEFTVLGDKGLLETFLKEYDDDANGKLRYVWTESSLALSGGSFYGNIIDYNETIHPVVGLAKPKNYSLEKRAEGFNEDLDKVISRGTAIDGSTPYSAIFNFSYFNPKYFTKIKLDEDPQVGFRSGKYVVGRESKAYGVIESEETGNFSFGKNLFVTTLSGEFKPGETLIDEDGLSAKISDENTISHFIVNFRGSGYSDSGSNRANIVINGREYDSSIVELKISGGQIYNAEIVNSTNLQEKYVSPPVITVTPDAGLGQRAVITAVLNKNTVLTYNNQNIKSFSSEYNNYSFTSDIDTSSSVYSTQSQVTSFTFTGEKGRKFITCNGFGTDLSRDLVPGDLIQYTDDNGVTIKNVVQSTTDSVGTVKSRIYLDYALANDITNATVIRVRPIIKNSTKSSLIFPTGSKQVASLVKSTEDTKFKYFIRKDFVTDLAASGSFVTFSAQLTSGTQRFVRYTEENYIVTVLDAGDSTAVETGDILYINPEYVQINSGNVTSNQVTSGSLVISLPNSFFLGEGQASLVVYPKLKLTATVEIDKARPRLKTAIRNRRITIPSAGDRVIPLRGTNYDENTIESLSYSDVFKLRYVYEGTTSNPPEADADGNLVSGSDISYKYTFDDGQRDTFFDVSRIVLKPGFDAPQGQLLVAFDYFEHSLGDFSTVDSYVHQAGVAASEIPNFNSSVYGTVNLKDVIDLRPKVDSEAVITGFQDVSILNTNSGISFTGPGGIPTATPAVDTNLEFTFSFSEKQYLDRMDGVFLNKNGEVIVEKGNASLNPSKPEIIDDAIALAYLHIPAFTNSTKDVRIIPVDNRRYTMRDIGKLEKRIECLEFYTSLSILEQQALNMQIKDDIGLDRFKAGFVVDAFEAHSAGNLASVDYQCAIDSQQSVLRPQSKEDSFVLKEVNVRNDQRVIDGYVNNHGVITLPYNNLPLLGNSNATGTINPNPFVVIQYVGDANISPTIDQWYDDSIEPLVVDTNTKLNSILLAKVNPKESLASLYDSFVVNWVGTDKTLFNINGLSDINTENIITSTSSASVASSSNISPQNNELGKGVNSKVVNGRTVATGVQFFARSIPVKFTLNRLKPNTKIFVYLEGRDIGRWANPDGKYTGIAGNSLTTFGSDLVTDSTGSLSGIILVPAGFPPSIGARWTGNVDTVLYDTLAEELRITEGSKTFFFSSDGLNKEELDTYAEVQFYASGIVPSNPQSIISSGISYFKANEGIQFTNSNTDQEVKPNPLAQTFRIEGFEGGVFVTGLDLYFSQKSSNVPIRAYITDINSGAPGKNILPGSQVTLFPDTQLVTYITGNSDTVVLFKGETVSGMDSGAKGPLKTVLDKNGIPIGDELSTTFTLNRNQTYTLVLSNHNGISFLQDEIISTPSVKNVNTTENKNIALNIAKDSGRVVDLKINDIGEKYQGATITIESPQLPGSSTASADIQVSNGSVYNVDLVLSGNGYTEAPAVVVGGIGTGASGAIVESIIEIDTPAVRMGVASDSLSINPTLSTTPSYFKFKYPVYLQNDTEYALNIETDSIDYVLWSSKLGEQEVTTNAAVTTQPLLGSLYKSQNTDNFVEDLFEDLKFTLYKAEFSTSAVGSLRLANENPGFEKLETAPFETSVRSPINATSDLFKGNNAIVKVLHRDNGFEDRGKSFVFFKKAEDTGGIPAVTLNGELYEVINCGLDFYNIVTPSRAGSNILGGGSNVLASYNRKYERLYAQVSYLQLDKTSIQAMVKTTNIVPVDSNTQNYTSYQQSEYERTFLNEQHYFTNQKVIASRINQTVNFIENSLEYKISLSTENPNVSPVIDLNAASVKTATNRVENATGFESRYGKRYQELRFLPSYNTDFLIIGTPDDIVVGSVITGVTSGSIGKIVEWDGTSQAVIDISTTSQLIVGESITIVTPAGITVTSASVTIQALQPVEYDFSEGSNVVASYPLNLLTTYDNTINGKVIEWDSKDRVLIVDTPYRPINGDFEAEITTGSAFVRNSNASEQQQDIFRVNDILQSSDEKYLTIGSMVLSTGVDYVSDEESKNSSSLAKYVTKEVFINNPGTSIDVRLTATLTNVENVKVFYKFKKASSQENFDDINWVAFNIDGNPDVNDIATASNSISGNYELQSNYQELKYSVSNLPEFSSYSVKIIMKTDDPTLTPKIQDLRAVASY